MGTGIASHTISGGSQVTARANNSAITVDTCGQWPEGREPAGDCSRGRLGGMSVLSHRSQRLGLKKVWLPKQGTRGEGRAPPPPPPPPGKTGKKGTGSGGACAQQKRQLSLRV